MRKWVTISGLIILILVIIGIAIGFISEFSYTHLVGIYGSSGTFFLNSTIVRTINLDYTIAVCGIFFGICFLIVGIVLTVAGIINYNFG